MSALSAKKSGRLRTSNGARKPAASSTAADFSLALVHVHESDGVFVRFKVGYLKAVPMGVSRCPSA